MICNKTEFDFQEHMSLCYIACCTAVLHKVRSATKPDFQGEVCVMYPFAGLPVMLLCCIKYDLQQNRPFAVLPAILLCCIKYDLQQNCPFAVLPKVRSATKQDCKRT
jgi:hypothetical protein